MRKARRPSTARCLLLICLLARVQAAWAFHEQGVANCNGCHVTHGEGDGAALLGLSADEGLLIAESASDVCLLCHEDGLGAVLGSDPHFPPPERGGGNFAFLLEDNLNDAPDGTLSPIPGDAAGHNLVSPGHALGRDFRYSFSPGGTFPAAQLGCTSCHDPHGRAGFRLLYGVGEVQGGLFEFTAPAPQAEGIPLQGPGEAAARHTAYRTGMSDWCGNCHGRYHDNGDSVLEHPSGEQLEQEIVDQYNAYDGDEDPTGGQFPTAYQPAVPFEDAAATPTSTNGPTTSSRVMCLTCHRAHASSAPAAGRWDFNIGLLDEDGVASGSYPIPNPYRSSLQGSLCSKCHEGGELP